MARITEKRWIKRLLGDRGVMIAGAGLLLISAIVIAGPWLSPYEESAIVLEQKCLRTTGRQRGILRNHFGQDECLVWIVFVAYAYANRMCENIPGKKIG